MLILQNFEVERKPRGGNVGKMLPGGHKGRWSVRKFMTCLSHAWGIKLTRQEPLVDTDCSKSHSNPCFLLEYA